METIRFSTTTSCAELNARDHGHVFRLYLLTKAQIVEYGVTWRHLVVLGSVAGVGFTMALFIAQLAFEDAQLLTAAKLGVLAASAAACVLSLVLGRVLLTAARATHAAPTADAAEVSTEH